MARPSIALLYILIVASRQSTTRNTGFSANGVWESIGSGWILEIDDSTKYTFFDITDISCIQASSGSFDVLSHALTPGNDTLKLEKGVITYKFVRTELPALCRGTIHRLDRSPLHNFDVFAETVSDHYAFLELNNIDWNQLRNEQRQRLSDTSTDIELYQVINETLEELNDNHAFLEANDSIYAALDAHEEEQADTEHLPEYGDFVVAQMVAEHHLQEEMTEDSWLIQWGKMTDSIGFIQVKAMWLFADLEIPKQSIEELGYVDAFVQTFHKKYEGEYIEKEVAAVSKIMDKVMEDLSGMASIVLDVRFNGGGQDAVSFEILSRFISEEKLQVATQKLKYGNGFTDAQPLHIRGRTEAYMKPVYILTSQQTASAAEALAIATMAMGNAKRVGSHTSGAMSTALEKTLPNGWSFAISNEVYMDNQGNSYENIGIPPDIELVYPEDRQTFFRSVVDDLEADRRSIRAAVDKFKRR